MEISRNSAHGDTALNQSSCGVKLGEYEIRPKNGLEGDQLRTKHNEAPELYYSIGRAGRLLTDRTEFFATTKSGIQNQLWKFPSPIFRSLLKQKSRRSCHVAADLLLPNELRRRNIHALAVKQGSNNRISLSRCDLGTSACDRSLTNKNRHRGEPRENVSRDRLGPNKKTRKRPLSSSVKHSASGIAKSHHRSHFGRLLLKCVASPSD